MAGLKYDRIREFFGWSINGGNASMIARLTHYNYDPLRYKGVKKWYDECLHKPPLEDQIMPAINEEIHGFGVEVLTVDGEIVAEYINRGDTYTPTVLRDLETGEFMLTSWGDWIEEKEARDSTFRYNGRF